MTPVIREMSEGQYDFMIFAFLATFVGLILYILWLHIDLRKMANATKVIKVEILKKEAIKKEAVKETEKMTREKRDLIAKVEELELTIRELTETHAELPPVVWDQCL